MKDQKVFVGTASHQWNDPFTYAIGTTQSEVDEYLRESSIEESKHNLDDCDSLETEDCQHNGCGSSVDVADDISYGSYEIDSVEQFGSVMNDEEVIKLGILDEICITSDIVQHNGKINLVASYDPFTADGFHNPNSVVVRMGYMDYSFDEATGLIVYDLLDEISETLIAIEDGSIMAGQANDFIG